MSEAKTQNRGHCQCCGRLQAVLAKGLISNHGYEVKDGYFNGVCSGHRYLPLEISRAVADATVARVRKEVKELIALAKKIKARKVLPETCQGRYNPQRREYDQIPFADASQYQQDQTIETWYFQTTRRAEMGTSFADSFEKLIERVHGQALQLVTLAPPTERILPGEKRELESGKIAEAVSVDGRRVYYSIDGVYKFAWQSPRSWRLLKKI
jgi:hypothetical protein